jgi:hypothetical protein
LRICGRDTLILGSCSRQARRWGGGERESGREGGKGEGERERGRK